MGTKELRSSVPKPIAFNEFIESNLTIDSLNSIGLEPA